MSTTTKRFQSANAAAQRSPTAGSTPSVPVQACRNTPTSRVISAYFASQNITETEKPKSKRVAYTRLSNALVGQKVWLIVDTKELEGKTLNVEIMGSKNTTFVAPDAVVSVLSGGGEVTQLTGEVGALSSNKEYSNGADFKDQAVTELELRPADKTKEKEWSKKIHDSAERRAYLHLGITAVGGNDTEYTSEDPSLPSTGNDKSVLMNGDGLYFELMECCYGITQSQLSQIFPSAGSPKLMELSKVFNEAYDKFSVDSCLRKAHFFAQMREEVGTSATNHEESLNYDAERLKREVAEPGKKKGPFSYFWNHTDEADLYGRTAKQAANQEAIANRAYADRNGNGNIASGDGWRYRGKGYIQLTGKSNYQSVQTEIDAKYPGSGIDIIKNGEDILTIRGAMLSAMAFWSSHRLHEKADAGATDAAVDSITRVINRDTDSYAARRGHFNSNKTVFKTADCPRKP